MDAVSLVSLTTLWLGIKKQRFGQRVKCLPCKLSDPSSRTGVEVKGKNRLQEVVL